MPSAQLTPCPIVHLPTSGLILLEASLKRWLANKAASEQQAVVQATLRSQVSERLAAAYGQLVQVTDQEITFELLGE